MMLVRNRKPGRGKRSTPVDVEVGKHIRVFRRERGMSQTDLGDALGITFQQVQKYEKGTNRVSASMLHRMAGILGEPVGAFFSGIEIDAASGQIKKNISLDMLQDEMAYRMLCALTRIQNSAVRLALTRMAEEMVAEL